MLNCGKITEEEIKELKVKEGVPLYKYPYPLSSKTNPDEIIFKAISVAYNAQLKEFLEEAKGQGMTIPVEQTYRRIVKTCVVRPVLDDDLLDEMPIGFVEDMAKRIQEKSGLVDIDIAGRILGPDNYSTMLQDYKYWAPPTQKEVDDLKAEYNTRLQRIRIDKFFFVVRPLTRVDMNIAETSLDGDSTIARAVTVWPKQVEWDTLPAGYILILVKLVSDISGWGVGPEEIEIEEL